MATGWQETVAGLTQLREKEFADQIRKFAFEEDVIFFRGHSCNDCWEEVRNKFEAVLAEMKEASCPSTG